MKETAKTMATLVRVHVSCRLSLSFPVVPPSFPNNGNPRVSEWAMARTAWIGNCLIYSSGEAGGAAIVPTTMAWIEGRDILSVTSSIRLAYLVSFLLSWNYPFQPTVRSFPSLEQETDASNWALQYPPNNIVSPQAIF
jgi:hypothetical protein